MSGSVDRSDCPSCCLPKLSGANQARTCHQRSQRHTGSGSSCFYKAELLFPEKIRQSTMQMVDLTSSLDSQSQIPRNKPQKMINGGLFLDRKFRECGKVCSDKKWQIMLSKLWWAKTFDLCSRCGTSGAGEKNREKKKLIKEQQAAMKIVSGNISKGKDTI